ncbi:MAG TPA: allantoinase AllB [Verrucomicrobiae bacterium]|nr:allantoinase AllB [Verrucomicrobiae bacterium]
MPEKSHSRSGSAPAPDLVVRGKRVVTPDGEISAAIQIRSGAIQSIGPFDALPSGVPVFDAGGLVVMPGLVDTHVHINEPGRAQWEGFSTATQAAAAGGVTTLVEMPLNSIPATTTLAAFHEKCAAAEGKLWVDAGFWGGVVPGNVLELRPLWDAGVFGFKCFLVPSGVDEFAHVAESDLRAALPILASLGAPLLAHAESPGPIEAALPAINGLSPRQYSTWLASRPREAENQAIALLLRLAAEFAARVHIVHLSSSDALPALQLAKAANLAVTVETCPHYLTFAAEEIPDGATQFKCAPPLRERENRELLWAALQSGLIDFVVTDHSPCPPSMKLLDAGDFLRAWGGIASLELSLPAVWTEALSRGYSVPQLAGWMSAGPARFAGLGRKKGAIAVGFDADLVVWNPDARFRADAARLRQRHKITPYSGRELAGVVEATFVRGQKVFHKGEFASAPSGKILRRGLP